MHLWVLLEELLGLHYCSGLCRGKRLRRVLGTPAVDHLGSEFIPQLLHLGLRFFSLFAHSLGL